MWSKLVARSSRANLLCLLIFVVGTVIRWRYIFVVHDPRNSMDSEPPPTMVECQVPP